MALTEKEHGNVVIDVKNKMIVNILVILAMFFRYISRCRIQIKIVAFCGLFISYISSEVD